MKKIALFALTLVMVLTAVCPAFAAGKLVVNQEKFYSIEPYEDSFYAYVFAEVTNAGDAPVKCQNELWEIFDPEGNPLDSKDYVTCHPEVIEPGAVGYALATIILDDIESADQAADYMLTLSPKTVSENTFVTLPATVVYRYTPGSYNDSHELIATVTNDTSDSVYKFCVAYAVKDAAGNLQYVADVQTYNVGILPGTSVEVMCDLSYESLVEHLLEQDILNFDQVEVVAYVDTDY